MTIVCNDCGLPDAVTYCYNDCGKDLCCDCIKMFEGKPYCSTCYDEITRDLGANKDE